MEERLYLIENKLDTIKNKLDTIENRLDSNMKNLETNIEAISEKKAYHINIPKKIHLTCKNKNNIDNIIWEECLQKYRLIYPDYEIIIYDNEDIYNIIQKYYPEYLYKIKKIKIGAILADIFRYLILYLEGGIYSDLDCEPLKKIDELLDSDFKYYHGDKNRDNNYWIYNNDRRIINKEWDFKKNICDNYEEISKKHIIHMKCLGHKIGNVSTILGYEFHPDFINMKNNFLNEEHPATKIYNCQICQWFMISEPKQNIFLKMFISIMDNLDILINIKKNDKNYHKTVINMTGPSGFTKIVMNNFTEKIPCDFFCCGSANGTVPKTRNSYVKHHYTGTWLNSPPSPAPPRLLGASHRRAS